MTAADIHLDQLPIWTPDMSHSEYRAVPYASRSTMVELLRGRTPHHRIRAEKPGETPALRFGRAAHTRFLEPESQFKAEYVVGEARARRSNVDKAWWAEFEATAAAKGCTVLARQEGDMLDDMMASLNEPRHWMARWLLRGAEGMSELSVFWHHWISQAEGLGLPCKARLDRYVPSMKAIVELKTDQDASPLVFGGTIYGRKYYVQSGVYREAAQRVGLDCEAVIIVVVEKQPPYLWAHYNIPIPLTDAGWKEVQPALITLAECYSTGEWPGFSENIEDAILPEGAINALREKGLLET